MKKINKLLSALTILAIIFSFATQAFAATLPSISSITCYTINSSGKVYAYKSNDLKEKTGGYIACSTDECQILKVSGNALQVKYPVSGGTKTAWFSRSEFTSYDISKREAEKWTQANKITTYRRSDGKTSFGYVSAGDVCYKLTAKGSYTQILYPISGNKNFKMGWVKTSDISTTSIGAPRPSNNKYSETLEKMADGSSYNGVYKVGKKYTGPYSSEQCKGFAKSVHEKLFGYNIGSTLSKPNNYKIDISSKNTKSLGSITANSSTNDIKNLFSKARPGDFVQIRRTHTGSHSAIVYSVSDSGVTFFEANLDNKNTISKKNYTWKSLRDANQAISVYSAENY